MLLIALLITAMKSAQALQCTTTHLTTAFGHVQSENGEYRSDSSKCWLIEPIGAERIYLSFQDFNTEAGMDVLQIYAGSTDTSPKVLLPRAATVVPARLLMLIGCRSRHMLASAGTSFHPS